MTSLSDPDLQLVINFQIFLLDKLRIIVNYVIFTTSLELEISSYFGQLAEISTCNHNLLGIVAPGNSSVLLVK